jgi:hypothetical protein
LRDCPAPGRPIYGDRRPCATILVAEVDQQRVRVVLDAQAMIGVGFLV